ncbi:uncharacterized protein [Centruroides vittatus]|uniref:uncharacterized protein n=1 Tax=Centruroides vittatus TaxID=120091 RepID=UPI00350FA7FE
MSLKRQCGFDSISTETLRKSNLKKGEKLFKCGHVSKLREISLDQNTDPNVNRDSTITGEVVPQISVSKKPYHVEIKLNKKRKIVDSHCQCQAGMGQCKHKAALIFAVNEESCESRTSEPQEWGKPSTALQQKYKKGHTLAQLFGDVLVCRDTSKNPPLHFLEAFRNSPDNALTLMLKKEDRDKTRRVCRDLLCDILDRVDKLVTASEVVETCLEIFSKQNEAVIYHLYECEDVGCNILKLQTKKFLLDEKCALFYNVSVLVTANEAADICVKTVNQSQCTEWFSERRKRLSASIAHRIKTRRDHYNSLAYNLAFGKLKPTVSMKYGICNEPLAIEEFSKSYHFSVRKSGLIVNVRQPWLCCSPDGLIKVGSEFILLEIKCPFSCKDKPIVNYKDKICNVNYLQFEG